MRQLLRNLARHKGRSGMTAAAVAASVALLLGMFAVGEGLVQSTIEDLGKTPVDFVLSGGGAAAIRGAHRMSAALTADPRIEMATGELDHRLSVRIAGDPRPKGVVAEGIVPGDARKVISDKDKGNFPSHGISGFTDGGDPHAANNYTGPWTDEILLDQNFARTFGLKRGDTVGVSASPTTQGRNYTVVGTFDPGTTGQGELASLYLAVMHLSELQTFVGLDLLRHDNGTVELIDAVDTMAVRATVDTRTTRGGLDDLLKFLQKNYPYLTVTSRQDQVENAEQSAAVARIFFGLLGGISLVIGLLFVGCIMIMTVSERTNEFGMLRAIGISRRTIFLGVLAESIVLVAIGAFAGLIPGYGAALGFAQFVESTSGQQVDFVKFSPDLVVPLLGTVLGLGVLVSLSPAWVATSIPPAKALRRVR